MLYYMVWGGGVGLGGRWGSEREGEAVGKAVGAGSPRSVFRFMASKVRDQKPGPAAAAAAVAAVRRRWEVALMRGIVCWCWCWCWCCCCTVRIPILS